MRIASFRTWVVGNPPPHFGGRYFVLRQARHRRRHRGHRRGVRRDLRPAHVARMVEDVCDRHVARRRPVPHRGALARRLRARLLPGGPTSRSSASSAGSRSRCWDIVGKAVGRPVYDLLGGRVRERLRGYTYLYPEPGDATDVYPDPELGRRAGRRVRRRAASRRSSSTRPGATRRSIRASRGRGARPLRGYVASVREAVGARLRPAVRDARAVHGRPARSGWRAGSSNSTRSGSRSRRRRRRPRRWRASRARPRSRSRRANG